MKKSSGQIVRKHLKNISRALLEGERRASFLSFLKEHETHGVYALYKTKGNGKFDLWYVGKASVLKQRLNHHLKDSHADKWDNMALFILDRSVALSEIESLLVATATPPGNKQKPRAGTDLRPQLKKFFMDDMKDQIDGMVFPEKKKTKSEVSKRLTPKKLKALINKIGQNKLAQHLGISQAYVSRLYVADSKHLSQLLRYIYEGGYRDKILLIMEKKL